MSSILLATSPPFFVNVNNFSLPCLSKFTSPSVSISCNIFTTWEYVQSIDFASELAYTSFFAFLSSTSIIAGFSRKNVLNISLFLFKRPTPNYYVMVVMEYIFKCFAGLLLSSIKSFSFIFVICLFKSSCDKHLNPLLKPFF